MEQPTLIQVRPPSRKVKLLLREPRDNGSPTVWSSFVIRQPTDEGLLLYNTLTLELLHVPAAFADNLEAPEGELREALRKKWYLVPGTLDQHRTALELRQTLRDMEPPAGGIKKYTVLTTTACNARCFYCFEQGWEVRTMSPETADKAAEYMLAHSSGVPFVIDWFGGEPLVNLRVIDRICQRLTEGGADFSSTMASNGSLFDPEIIARAADLWRLRHVNITLDGMGEDYERVKNYKTIGKGAFDLVMQNIRGLAAAGVRVTIRMNFDLYNLEQIRALTDYLIAYVAGTPGISAYPAILIEDPDDPAAQRSDEARTLLWQEATDLRAKLEQAGLLRPLRLLKEQETHMCMADSRNMITILPEGQIGLCESYIYDGFIGSLDSPDFDRAEMEAMEELREEIPACADCPLFPNCIRLKKCPTQICHPQRRKAKVERTRRSMLLEWSIYQARKTKNVQRNPEGKQ